MKSKILKEENMRKQNTKKKNKKEARPKKLSEKKGTIKDLETSQADKVRGGIEWTYRKRT